MIQTVTKTIQEQGEVFTNVYPDAELIKNDIDYSFINISN